MIFFFVGCTGFLPPLHEMTEATTRNALVIDAVVLPVASFVLGLKVRSSRCMVLTVLNLICIVIISFASLGAIADRTEIDPFASSIVMSLGIALCFDYSLFVLSRFREELSGGVGGPQGTKAALRTSLATAGHVVLVSGSTLSVTFLILIPFPQNFFLSIGIGCGIVIVVSMACVLTLTPALILSFQWFSSPDECKAHSVAHYTKVGNSKIEVQIDIFTDCDPVQEGNLEELVGFDRSCVPHGPRSELHPQSKEGGCRQTSKSILKGAFDVCSDKLLWLKMTLWVAKHGWFTLAMVCIAVGPFAWKFFSLVTTRVPYLQHSLQSSSIFRSYFYVTARGFQCHSDVHARLTLDDHLGPDEERVLHRRH